MLLKKNYDCFFHVSLLHLKVMNAGNMTGILLGLWYVVPQNTDWTAIFITYHHGLEISS